ncbi:MAG: hypothetical protein ACK5PJ_02400 [Ralstonia sp.]|jgi:hypothetical protein
MTDKIDPTKQYRCRDGSEWRYIGLSQNAEYPIAGEYNDDELGWTVTSWAADGRYIVGEEDAQDLIEVRPRIQQKVWINVYPGNAIPSLWETRQKADECAGFTRSACLEVTLDYEVGQGLE